MFSSVLSAVGTTSVHVVRLVADRVATYSARVTFGIRLLLFEEKTTVYRYRTPNNFSYYIQFKPKTLSSPMKVIIPYKKHLFNGKYVMYNGEVVMSQHRD